MENVKKSEKIRKSEKIAKNLKKIKFFSKIWNFWKIFFLQKKKNIYPLSFPILGVLNSTRALQSSPSWALRSTEHGARTEILVFNIGLLPYTIIGQVFICPITRSSVFPMFSSKIIGAMHVHTVTFWNDNYKIFKEYTIWICRNFGNIIS